MKITAILWYLLIAALALCALVGHPILIGLPLGCLLYHCYREIRDWAK